MTEKKTILFLPTAVLLLINTLSAAVHYVSPGGTVNWAQSGILTTPCSLPTANANAGAGDTVYLLAGIYTGVYIKPSQSGSAGNPIMYSRYSDDSVTITDADYGIIIDGKSRIIINGLRFYFMGNFVCIKNNSNYNTIGYCIFDKARDTTTWSGANIYYTSQYNRVHHCSFSRWGYANDSGHAGALFDVGREAELTDSSYYNLIDNNTFFYGGHHCLAAWSKYCIFRNNYLHHERSPTDGFGYRCAITHGKAVDRNLFEGNRFAFAYKASGMSLRSSNNIFRFNVFYNNGLGGIQCVSMVDYTPAHYNRMYNNVFFNNGHEADYVGFSGGIYFCNWGEGDPIGNVVKNNIFYKNKGGSITTDAVTTPQVVVNNWDTGDPLFVDDESALSPFNPNLPDFHLQEGSPCIDKGVSITKITSADGSGKQFTVEDAGYFTNGWGMVPGDQIQLEGTKQRARLTVVDYDKNILTVDNTLTWTQNTGVGLAYEGSAPDLGAYEYADIIPIKDQLDNKRMKNRITIHQNSSHGIVIIQIDNSSAVTKSGTLRIHNLSGSLVDELKAREGRFLWNTASVPNGAYIMRLEVPGNNLKQRLLLIRY